MGRGTEVTTWNKEENWTIVGMWPMQWSHLSLCLHFVVAVVEAQVEDSSDSKIGMSVLQRLLLCDKQTIQEGHAEKLSRLLSPLCLRVQLL